MKAKWRINWNAVFTLAVLVMTYTVLAVITYFTIIGIKYTLDETVYFGAIDRGVCTIVPYYITRQIYRINEKYSKKGCNK